MNKGKSGLSGWNIVVIVLTVTITFAVVMIIAAPYILRAVSN